MRNGPVLGLRELWGWSQALGESRTLQTHENPDWQRDRRRSWKKSERDSENEILAEYTLP